VLTFSKVSVGFKTAVKNCLGDQFLIDPALTTLTEQRRRLVSAGDDDLSGNVDDGNDVAEGNHDDAGNVDLDVVAYMPSKEDATHALVTLENGDTFLRNLEACLKNSGFETDCTVVEGNPGQYYCVLDVTDIIIDPSDDIPDLDIPTPYPTPFPTSYPTPYPTPSPTAYPTFQNELPKCQQTTCVRKQISKCHKTTSNGHNNTDVNNKYAAHDAIGAHQLKDGWNQDDCQLFWHTLVKGPGANNERFHCARVGNDDSTCECVCDSTLECSIWHHHYVNGQLKVFKRKHCAHNPDNSDATQYPGIVESPPAPGAEPARTGQALETFYQN
jgi:hypothetical protein